MANRKTPSSGVRKRSTSGEEAPSGPSELILYTTPDHQTRIEVRLESETVWLSQRQMAELFQKSVPTINEHIANIYEEGELDRDPTIRKSRIVQTEGGREVGREVELYNLDVIISVGYRVKSHRGTQFRIWATQRLREYIVKGFALDDERLKEMRTLPGGQDYFELLAHPRHPRLGTPVLPEDLRHLCDQRGLRRHGCGPEILRHGAEQTALGHSRQDCRTAHLGTGRRHETEHGLTTWKNAPAGPIRKADAEVAKNYLTEKSYAP